MTHSDITEAEMELINSIIIGIVGFIILMAILFVLAEIAIWRQVRRAREMEREALLFKHSNAIRRHERKERKRGNRS